MACAKRWLLALARASGGGDSGAGQRFCPDFTEAAVEMGALDASASLPGESMCAGRANFEVQSLCHGGPRVSGSDAGRLGSRGVKRRPT
jgi:hypothetical protein